MSQRHRSHDVVQPPKVELRAHAHNERHRINSELQSVAAQVSAGYEPDEVHEPGRAWVPGHQHDAEQQERLRQQLGANFDPTMFDSPEIHLMDVIIAIASPDD